MLKRYCLPSTALFAFACFSQTHAVVPSTNTPPLSAQAQAATNSAPVNLGTILVEGTPISKYRAETVSTATFVDAKPEELPQTVDVLTEDFIEEMNPTDLHDLLRYEPGISDGGKTT